MTLPKPKFWIRNNRKHPKRSTGTITSRLTESTLATPKKIHRTLTGTTTCHRRRSSRRRLEDLSDINWNDYEDGGSDSEPYASSDDHGCIADDNGRVHNYNELIQQHFFQTIQKTNCKPWLRQGNRVLVFQTSTSIPHNGIVSKRRSSRNRQGL